MALFSDGAHTPLMDASMSASMRRRLNELFGLAFLLMGTLLGAALWTYNIGDPSPFSATTAPAMNALGEPGAIIADTAIRYLGLGAWVPVVFLVVWGLRYVLHAGEERIWARMLLVPLAVIFLPVFASTHAVHDGWQLSGTGLGGGLGDAGARMALDLIPLSDAVALRVLSLALAVLVACLGLAALGFTMIELRLIGRWLARSLGLTTRAVATRAHRIGTAGAVRARDKLREVRAKPRSETMEPAEPTGAWRRHAPILRATEDPADDDADAGIQNGRTGGLGWRNVAPALTGLTGRLKGLRAPQPGPVPAGRDEPTVDMDGAPRNEIAAPQQTPLRISDEEPAAQSDDTHDSALRTVFDRLSSDGDFQETVSDPIPLAADLVNADPAAAPEEAQAARTPVAHDRRRDRTSKRAEAERQPSLALEPNEGHVYEVPPLALLTKPAAIHRQTSDTALEENARMLETVLEDYGVRGEIVAVRPGPVVTLYELEPAPGLKASRVIGLADDIARSMSALAARVSTVPGRSIIGIELPNSERETVWLRDVFEKRDYGDARFPLALALGKDISGAPVVANLAKMPHLLIAGTTGSGKSVAINTMILSLLYRLTPKQCRLIMIDPKMLELSVYDNIPHLLAPVVTDPKKAIVALKWAVAEMEERYRKMSKMGVRNIDGYNARVRAAQEKGEDFSRTVQTGFDEFTGEPVYETETFEPEEMPYIVVIVDEMADLMMVAGKEIEACIQRLAQMARASGIHLIMATQRPSVDVITGTIKSNFPTRISFQVTSKIDSRTILGEQGAEQLLGMGDMLYMEGGGRIGRVHGPFVSDEEVEEVVRHLKSQGVPDYVNAVTDGVDEDEERAVDEKLGLAAAGSSEDQLYDMAVAIVARDRKCSTSYIQRKLAIGYNKAARLVEQMEDQGVVTPANSVGKREILIEER